MIQGYGSCILPLDAIAARAAGQLSDAATAAGRNPGFPDVAIASIVFVNKLVVLTRNVRHFDPLGVAYTDPLEALPSLTRKGPRGRPFFIPRAGRSLMMQ